MQLIVHALGGKVEPADHREYGSAELQVEDSGEAADMFIGLPSGLNVWMSHGDHIQQLPDGFSILGWSTNSPIAAMSNGRMVGLQFHPEVNHTEHGTDIIRNFLVNVAGCETNWSAESFVDAAIREIRERVGDGRVLLGLSGGVDSSVAAALIHKAIGDQLTPVFVNNGLLRQGEADAVRETFTNHFQTNLVYVDASDRFLGKLQGVSDPEEKRKIIGEIFVRVFEAEAEKAGPFQFLAQGTLYPDVIESATASAGSKTASKIKTHHNVGGLPEDMEFELLEPFRLLFKDEVRAVGRLLGVPDEIVERQPFPGPGLAVRILGEINETGPRPAAQGRRGRPRGDREGGLQQGRLAVLRRPPPGELHRRHGRLPHLRARCRRPRHRQPGRDDRRLGEAPLRRPRPHQQPHRQRGRRHQPRRLRHHLQAARNHRVGVTT